MKSHLVLQIVPPVRPSLLDASSLLDDGSRRDRSENGEGHGDSMIVVAVNADVLEESLDLDSMNDDSVVELRGLDSELPCSSETKTRRKDQLSFFLLDHQRKREDNK